MSLKNPLEMSARARRATARAFDRMIAGRPLSPPRCRIDPSVASASELALRRDLRSGAFAHRPLNERDEAK